MTSQTDREIVRRVREAWPDWANKPPPQSLVAQIATDHGVEVDGMGPVCGVTRARRLRGLVTTLPDTEPQPGQTARPEDQTPPLAREKITAAGPWPMWGGLDFIPVPDQEPAPTADKPQRPPTWPVFLLVLPAFVAVWSGWVQLGRQTGFGTINLLPGLVADGLWSTIDTAITLPIGLETYAGFAMWVWISGRAGERATRFARTSTIAALGLGASGQIATHLLAANGRPAPWLVVIVVACLPVIVLGMGAALAHLVRADGGQRSTFS